MDSVTAARSMRGSIGMLAMTWLITGSTTEKAAARGLAGDGLEGYALGRLGVLGDCPVDDVLAAAYFWEPDMMRRLVAAGRTIMTPAEGAAIYCDICQEWGREHLAGMAGVERLGELLETVVNAADPGGAATFAGWRDMPLPTDAGPARTFQLAQVMRELRFGRHIVAVTASVMTPLESVLAGPSGEWNAKLFGWPQPYPDVSHLAEPREAVEAATDQLHAPDLEILTDTERVELRALAKAARTHASEK